MKCILFVFILIIMMACGRSKQPTTVSVLSEELQDQVDRMMPLLYWCDGQASGSGNNNIDGRPHCDVGDGAFSSGFLTLVGKFPQKLSMFAALTASFGPDGQPFRAPSYVGLHTSDEFSRDQALGFIEAAIAGHPKEYGAARVWEYYKRTGKLCPHPTDNRCAMTPSTKILFDYILGKSVTQFERAVDAATMLGSASTVPLNYQAALVSYHIFAISKLGKLTAGYANAAAVLYKRAPNNLWFHTLFHMTSRASPEDFQEIARKLHSCMESWQAPGSDWAWSSPVECNRNAWGQELVALAHLLLNSNESLLLQPHAVNLIQ